MIKKIISIISSNTDPNQTKIPIGSILNQTFPCTFENIINRFSSLIQQYHLTLPNELSCLKALSAGKFLDLVDEFPVKDQRNQMSPTSTKLSRRNS